MTTAYLLHAWTGPRLSSRYDYYETDRLTFLRHHVETLKKLDHDLDKIVITHNKWGGDEPYVLDYIDSLNGIKIGAAKVEVVKRQNLGVSYGGYADFFNRTECKDYDYLILIEDDYVPVLDHFDKILIDELEKDKATSYLCSLVGYGHCLTGLPHAAISNGIVRGSIAAQVAESGARLHSGWITDSTPDDVNGQVLFSQAFLPFGSLKDLGYKYKAPFLSGETLSDYYPENEEVLIVPYQWDIIHNQGEL